MARKPVEENNNGRGAGRRGVFVKNLWENREDCIAFTRILICMYHRYQKADSI